MIKKKTGLGKGLGALIKDDTVEKAGTKTVNKQIRTTKTNSDISEKNGEMMLKISLIEPNREQPRKNFDEELISELAESIKQHGVIQPLLVQKKNKFYEIIAGERRWRAAKLAGLKEVPVIVREYTKQETMEVALIENVQRSDLNPIEEALAYRQLMEEFSLKQEDIASRVSKNRATITNSMRLLKLSPEVQKMLMQNMITGGHARALLTIDDDHIQLKLAKKIVDEKLSVRDTEKLVKQYSKKDNEKNKPQKVSDNKDLEFIYRDLEEKMKTAMGTKVHINKKDKNKGRIEIEYYSAAELERLVELIQTVQN